ncbi:MAG: ABC transporter permease [Actinomycetota bacterium]|nr:ABC transporter permease [Actinomycetota bacterium]MDH5224755.1 ABC transporter permease [Actinomycetota bacterium]
MAARRSRYLHLHMWLLFTFLYLPIVVLVVLSFNASGLPTSWGGFSLEWYRDLLSNEDLLASIKNSLIVAGYVTAISTVLGTFLAIGLQRTVRSRVLDSVLFLPAVIPDIVLAIGLLSFFNLLRFTLGIHTIVIAHVVFDMIFVAAIVRTRLGYFDRRIEEAAADLGANPVKTFLLVTLPAIMPGVVAGALVAFTLSIDEFVIAFFNSGPGSITFPIRVYSMIRFGVTPVINAVAAIVMVVSLLTMLIALRLTRPKGERSANLGVGA